MNQQQKCLRVGLTAMACAAVIRLAPAVRLIPLGELISRPPVLSALTWLQTGRTIRYSPQPPELEPTVAALFPEPDLVYQAESPPPQPPPRPFFSDASGLKLWYLCPYRPDLEALLRSPLTWDLASGAPTVLIYHTHTTESYEKNGADYRESAPYRTTDPSYNVLSVGERIAELLNDAGIVTLQDREFHDFPNYNGSYGRTRKTTAQYLKEYPTLKLILDLHRDACDGSSGQLRTLARVAGKDSAQLMLVVGSNAAGLAHSHWQENLSLGLKLQAQLESQNPGITRPLSLRSQRFNQDLSPGALLIEVGGAGNSHGEAILAGEELARAIIALARGTEAPAPQPAPLSASPD